MAKGINTIINDTRQGVVGVLQNSNLPVSIAKMVVGEIYNQLIEQEKMALEYEAKQEQEENEKPKQEVIPNGEFKDEVR